MTEFMAHFLLVCKFVGNVFHKFDTHLVRFVRDCDILFNVADYLAKSLRV
jgi:hypothetical protein